jgi:hypothetical protein
LPQKQNKNNSKDRNCFIVTQKNYNKKELQGKNDKKDKSILLSDFCILLAIAYNLMLLLLPLTETRENKNQKKKKTLSERKESIFESTD